MITELFYPFAVGSDGGISATLDPDVQISQHVHSLVSTNPGDRRVVTAYGVPTREALFDPNDEMVADTLTRDAASAFRSWEPGIVLQNLSAQTTDPMSGVASLLIQYLRRESASTPDSIAAKVNEAVIAVGGTVSETIIG